MSFTLRVQGLGAFWPGANMTGSEFRRERLGQERLGQGAKWQYGRLFFHNVNKNYTEGRGC